MSTVPASVIGYVKSQVDAIWNGVTDAINSLAPKLNATLLGTVLVGTSASPATLDLTNATLLGLPGVDYIAAEAALTYSGSTSSMVLKSGAYSTVRAAQNTAHLLRVSAYAESVGKPVRQGPGDWEVQGAAGGGGKGLRLSLENSRRWLGAGKSTRYIFPSGSGQISGTLTTAGHTTDTADGLGAGITFGSDTTDYTNPAEVGGFTITTATGNTPADYTPSGQSARPSTAVGLALNGTTGVTVRQVTVSGFGIAFDGYNNAGGARFVDCWAPYTQNNYGINYRVGTISGADWSFYNNWIHGRFGGLVVAAQAGDLFWRGGQLSANNGNPLNLTASTAAAPTGMVDGIAAVVTHRDITDGTFAQGDGLPGTIISGGSVGLLTFRDLDFENTRGGYAVLRSYGQIRAVFEGFKATCGASGDAITGVARCTGFANGQLTFRNYAVQGFYASTQLMRFSGATVSSRFIDQDGYGTQTSLVTGYTSFTSGGSLADDWLTIDQAQTSRASTSPFAYNGTIYLTNIVRFSGLTSATIPYRAVRGPAVDSNGTWTRGNGSGGTETSTDGGTWTTVTGGGGSSAASTTWQPSDHGLISWPYDPSVATSGTALPVAGTLYLVRLHVPTATTVTNLLGDVVTAGSGLTAGQCFAGLFQGGTLLGTTADQSTAWATTGVKTMALTAPVAVAAGDVYVGVYYNGTTGPAFARSNGNALSNVGLSGNTSRYATGNTGLTTAMPGTLVSPLVAQSNAYWLALS